MTDTLLRDFGKAEAKVFSIDSLKQISAHCALITRVMCSMDERAKAQIDYAVFKDLEHAIDQMVEYAEE